MPQLELASIVSDLQGLQWLILGVLLFVLALVYRPQISAVVERLSGFKVQHRDTLMEGTLDRGTAGNATGVDGPASEEAPAIETNVASARADVADATKVIRENAESADAEEADAGSVRVQMFAAIEKRADEESRVLFERLQQLESDPIERKLNHGIWLYLRFVNGMEPEALNELEKLAADDTVAAQARVFKGLCYEWLGDFKAAITEYSSARDSARNEKQACIAIDHLAEAFDKAGDHQRAVEILEQALRDTESPEPRGLLWKSLAAIHESHDEHESRALALQRAGDYAPGNKRLRFSAAYAFSAADHEKFAAVMAHHYQTVLRLDPDHAAARNNLGVVFERKQWATLSVREYRKAMEGGNTLAASNLAYRYLNAGFAAEAEALIREAAQADSPHANVGEAMAAITRAREQQAEASTELTSAGRRQVAFLGAYTEARLRLPTNFAGKWRLPSGEVIEARWQDAALVGEWMVRRTRWKVEGSTYGSGAQLQFHEMEYWGSGADRSEWGFRSRVRSYAYLSADEQTLELMDLKEEGPVFRTLQRVPEDE